MPSCLARRREAARRSFGLTLASLASQEVSMAVCTCDYIDLPTNVTLTNPGFVRLVNEAGFGLKIATTSLGITASGTDTTMRFVVAAGGKVGIGTAAPTQQLHLVSNTDGLTLQIEATNPMATDTALDIKTVEREYKLGQNVGGLGVGKLLVYDITAGTARLTVDTTGNVGIGTTTPSQKLDVNGTIRTATGLIAGGAILLPIAAVSGLMDSSGTRRIADENGCYYAS